MLRKPQSFVYRAGELGKAEGYQKKALVINKETGNRTLEAACYLNLGSLFRSLGKYVLAKKYHEKALALSEETGDLEKQIKSHLELARDVLSEGNETPHEITSQLFLSIQKTEKMRRFLRENDRFKISLLDEHSESYHLLSVLFCKHENPKEALYVVELGRARALADIMSAQYSVKQQISINPPSWIAFERIMNKEINSICLYIF